MAMTALPVSEVEIQEFLAAFESGTLPKARWTHAAHLLTGACYVHGLGEEAAIEQMRGAVRRYNEAVGGQNTSTSGYHETITVFWIKVLAVLLASEAMMSRAEFAACAVERYTQARSLFRGFYDFDIVASTEARRVWIEPSLKRIEAANL
ncbi:hypothetical protein [Granulicella arctica]|uniref:Uncharacterized protein n=1 Tax=Granulicella arctica TaxID=940613 RepID=A0A7Y9TGN6_9BACT|nr:hypothetical protein [Granulicella arctica]NYF78955.1 hypothetical protein [Granulicella arctica]